MTTSNKKVVHYIGEAYMPLGLGGPAFVEVIDHPELQPGKDNIARTSTVVRIETSIGMFETENTIYKRVEQING